MAHSLNLKLNGGYIILSFDWYRIAWIVLITDKQLTWAQENILEHHRAKFGGNKQDRKYETILTPNDCNLNGYFIWYRTY